MEKRFYVFLYIVLLILTLFYNLGERPLFGVEGRWAEAAREMSLTGSYFVPTINFSPHITKPLIPFLLIKLSCSFFGYNEFAVRLPSAILALLSIVFFYFLARKLFDEKYRWLALLFFSTTLGFIEFARLAQSEIYQLFGLLVALSFYVNYRDRPSFLGYTGFFLGLLFGALSKGLTAPTVIISAVLIDVLLNKRYYHFNLKFSIVFVASIGIYFLHFYLIAKSLNSQLPFYFWFKENIKQAIDPYDNLRPAYIYLFYYPLWVSPYSLLLIFSLVAYFIHLKKISNDEKWLLFSNIVIFLIFTLAKARRGYYILSILPFAILLVITFLKNYQVSLSQKATKIIESIHKSLVYLFAFAILISFFFIKLFGYEIKPAFLILYFFLLILSFFIIWSFKEEKIFFWEAFSLITLCLLCLYYAGVQPVYSVSTEKLSGEFIKNLREQSTYLKKMKICYLEEKGRPVANVYFYAKITERILPIKLASEELSACGIVIVRKELDNKEREYLETLGYEIKEFLDKKEKSKSYLRLF